MPKGCYGLQPNTTSSCKTRVIRVVLDWYSVGTVQCGHGAVLAPCSVGTVHKVYTLSMYTVYSVAEGVFVFTGDSEPACLVHAFIGNHTTTHVTYTRIHMYMHIHACGHVQAHTDGCVLASHACTPRVAGTDTQMPAINARRLRAATRAPGRHAESDTQDAPTLLRAQMPTVPRTSYQTLPSYSASWYGTACSKSNRTYTHTHTPGRQAVAGWGREVSRCRGYPQRPKPAWPKQRQLQAQGRGRPS